MSASIDMPSGSSDKSCTAATFVPTTFEADLALLADSPLRLCFFEMGSSMATSLVEVRLPFETVRLDVIGA